VSPPSTLATTTAVWWPPLDGVPYNGISSCPLVISTIFALVAGRGRVLENTCTGAENAALATSRCLT
jgi:hypothetical protein